MTNHYDHEVVLSMREKVGRYFSPDDRSKGLREAQDLPLRALQELYGEIMNGATQVEGEREG